MSVFKLVREDSEESKDCTPENCVQLSHGWWPTEYPKMFERYFKRDSVSHEIRQTMDDIPSEWKWFTQEMLDESNNHHEDWINYQILYNEHWQKEAMALYYKARKWSAENGNEPFKIVCTCHKVHELCTVRSTLEGVLRVVQERE